MKEVFFQRVLWRAAGAKNQYHNSTHFVASIPVLTCLVRGSVSCPKVQWTGGAGGQSTHAVIGG